MAEDTENQLSRLRNLKWGNMVLELLVVFVGVFGAFQLDSYQSNRQEVKNQITYFKAFELVLDRYLRSSQSLKADVDSLAKVVASDPTAHIDFLPALDFTNSIYIVEAVFTSDRFSGIGSEFMMNLELGANQIKVLEQRVSELRKNINQAKILEKIETSVFREYYIDELHYISARLSRLIETIQQGAMPETKQIITELERG